MTGLAHRGWDLVDYGRHIVHPLREAGCWSALGEQHVSRDPAVLGYDHVVDIGTTRVHSIAPAALQLLRSHPPEPFFLSIGFFETHREFFEPSSVRDALYGAPPAQLPDTAATRADMAAFKASARSLDQGVGAVLHGLDEAGVADNTLVVLTTDHGLPLPNVDDSPSKSLLLDAGWAAERRPPVELYDLILDPMEMRNLAEDAEHARVRDELSRRLEEWMADTDDPLLDGPVPAPPRCARQRPRGYFGARALPRGRRLRDGEREGPSLAGAVGVARDDA